MSNKIFIMSGPSGAGKSTITKEVSKRLNIPLIISATTREPREGEKNGIDYFFLTKEEFEKKIEENGLLEYEKIHNNYYGTLISEVEKNLEKYGSVILEIDAKGTKQLIDKYNYDFVLIFCKTRTIEELKNRILSRASIDEDNLNKRIERVKLELEYEKLYKYHIINDDFDVACNEFSNIIKENIGV